MRITLSEMLNPRATVPVRFMVLVSLMAIAILNAAACSKAEPRSRDATYSEAGDPIPAGASADLSAEKETSRIGVLLVNHGSHSASWREMLLDVQREVQDDLRSIPRVDEIKTAFMEYNEPSIATQLRAFDEDGFDEIILVPLLLTVSSHSFDDIPTIYGAKQDARSLLALEAEGIECYTPKHARVTMTPLLDFTALLEHNIVRRLRALRDSNLKEGAVLVGYGSEPYNDEWEALFEHLKSVVQEEVGMEAAEHSWCGHIARYRKEPTVDAIKRVLDRAERALVIPVLVAHDEYFQGQVIGGAVEMVGQSERVVYVPDAILPDERVNHWVVSAVRDCCEQLAIAAAGTDSTERGQ